jgi:ribosome biogenesis GTPase
MQTGNTLHGIIMHSISGFYYVEAAGFVFACKAKGAFRKDKTSPLVGDGVSLETDGDTGFIVRIDPRKNFLVRPPIANLDKLFIVSSADRPKPNLYVIDKLTAFSVYHHIEPVIVFSKTDLADVSEYVDIYRSAGFQVLCCSAKTGEGMEKISDAISQGINAFSGNSGVGKSSLLNYLLPELSLETNEISDKLGRGRHTTRSVRLYRYRGGCIADTPGFSSIDFEENGERIMKEELASCFPEFEAYTSACTFFPSCSHTVDKGCAVLKAVQDGKISAQRHQSYCRMYEEVKDFKSWN